MAPLSVPKLPIDWETLETTRDRGDFDEAGYAFLARAGMFSEEAVESVRRSSASGLDADQAVLGGLLVRVFKLTSGVFVSTQAERTEAHSPLVRCAAETAVTLNWLSWKNDPEWFKRFRAE